MGRPSVDEVLRHKWLKESLDYRDLIGINERLIEDEESRTLNSDVIRILTTSLGFNFSEVITSVQKHRPSRCYATYCLLNKKYAKSQSQPKIVSLKEVRKEMEKSKLASQNKDNQSESDSGFENKSSSSETEMAKNGQNGQNGVTTTLPRTQSNQKPALARNNSSTLPAKPINKPVRYNRLYTRRSVNFIQ